MMRIHNQYRVLSLSVLILLPFLWQVTPGQKKNYNKTIVEYCDLVKNPEIFDGKEVTVRATYRYGFEWSEMYCIECRKLGKTWLEKGYLTKNAERVFKKLPKDDGTVNAVFTGTFESSKGPFGDGGYRFRFLLKSLDNVDLVSKSGADPEQLSDKERSKVSRQCL
ncbi:hypothetical protein [Leptolyngbya sp. 7M]|uniref:hypothetical protein n=1 Tax=Leptolyngbya sp. 7M TaxID=2812896 RepID=UPI001B8B6F85|nr:hypothetical protein [Leptolyngbya sp. 7M]QYO65811.1 hypothetical protein JVX88_03165 [Leptolyngbya sp. 7M]